MRKRFSWMLIILFLLSIALVACGGAEEETPAVEDSASETTLVETDDDTAAADNSEAPKPTATPVPAPTDTPEPTPEPTVAEEEFADLTALNADVEAFNSAIAQLTMTFSADGQPDSVVIMDMQFSQDPPGELIAMRTEGVSADDAAGAGALAAGGFTFATIGDTAYMSVPGEGCFSFSSAETDGMDPTETLFSPSDFTSEMNKARRIRPNETINGVETIHYQFDESSFITTEELDLATINGDIYIAADGGYLVRMVAEGTGPDMTMMDGVTEANLFRMEYNVMQVNEPIEITLPEGCDADSGGAEYPIAEDAAELATFVGFASYTSAMSADELGAFYQEAMPADGWTFVAEGSVTTGPFQTHIFTRDGEQVTVSIFGSDEGSQVLIAADE